MDRENHFEKQTLDKNPPIPANEIERLLTLGDLDLDYLDLESSLSDFTKLAAGVAGTSISVINLIDSYTQWSVSSFGLDAKQNPREDSVCQYTILEENSRGFEVKDLTEDVRFRDKPFLTKSPFLKYYFGVPLKVREGISLGALCVMHDNEKSLSPEKIEMLELIAGEVVKRIKTHFEIAELNRKMQEATSIKNRVAHDIRGPIGGIIGLAEILQIQGYENKLEEVLEFVSLIQKSGKSVLDLTDEILSSYMAGKKQSCNHEFTLLKLKEKILDMFGPMALIKKLELAVEISTSLSEVPFPKLKILQILGNLISNSIKFTPAGGKVEVWLDLEMGEMERVLKIKVKDDGVGIPQEKITEILNRGTDSSIGTSGEKGFGLGLQLVHHLVKSLNGQMLLKSKPDKGVEFELILPVT